MSGLHHPMFRSAALLALVAAIGVLLLSGVHELTRETIAEQERRMVLEQLQQVLPASAYDNALHDDFITLQDPAWFRHPGPVRVYRARKNGLPVAVIMQVTAADGYNGDIGLLVGILADGRISGVRVTRHRETPGLGDPIDIRRSDWITRFNGLSLGAPPVSAWAVKRDGGQFDQFTGATITPRAVVEAVERALAYHQSHAEALYNTPMQGESNEP